ncbi:hypothetical protein [Maritalea mediterranea]|uniref:Thioredoxin-like fold domain-containing protein n=1 Tax=Maritalea mediterranea TaxID=2909667 RepID=A0ABS9EDP8_9HYPH|nr:hypothetical protein [Maritalea mediterranea]MCF4099513.1 hypothetical protein [Maritalea mediterranea]
MAEPIKVFGFVPAWGLPTSGPFALKLLAWLNAHKIDYQFEAEMNTGKGPKGKSPWVEMEGNLIADSDVIIRSIAKTKAIDLHQDLMDPQIAAGHSLKVAFEERFHQILEWELFETPQGLAFIKQAIAGSVPAPLAPIIFMLVKRQFTKQLYARGISRHSQTHIVQLGDDLLTALESFIKAGGFARTVDPQSQKQYPQIEELSVYGQLAPMRHWTMATPVAQLVKERKTLTSWVDDVESLCFGAPLTAGSAAPKAFLSTKLTEGLA